MFLLTEGDIRVEIKTGSEMPTDTDSCTGNLVRGLKTCLFVDA
jgi:hypothetical protein